MLGIRKAITGDVNRRIEMLERQLEDERRRHKEELDILRRQMAIIARGQKLSEKAILEGQLHDDIGPDALEDFLANTDNVLVLDVRTDREWEMGYIPNAKHISIDQLSSRLVELADKERTILAVCASGARSAAAAELLTQNGFISVYNAIGGMHAYKGQLAYPQREALSADGVQGDDRELIQKVLEVLERDVRPNLQRDGGDIQLLAVKDGVADLKMLGACNGCGSQKVTVEQGIRNHLVEMIPGITGVRDLS